MVKVLFKKQLHEILSTFVRNKNKKAGDEKTSLRTALVFVGLFVLLGVSFGVVLSQMTPLLDTEFGWMFYTLSGMAAITFGVVGSIFNTYAGLYHAKDNDFLLSMPIPPRTILLVRLSGVLLMSALYSSSILLPAVVLGFVHGNIGVLAGLFSVLLIPVTWLFITAITCLLGWVVALCSGFFKNRKWIVTVLFLVVFIAYFRFTSRSSELIMEMISNPGKVGNALESWAHLFVWLGKAARGDALSMLLFTAAVAVLCALTWLFLTKTFYSITTKSEATAKAKYKEKKAKQTAVFPALLRKEAKRFLGSVNYMLNSGIGVLLFPAAGIFLLVKAASAKEALAGIGNIAKPLPLLLMAGCVLAASMFTVSAPSVSLEGKTLWLLQALPVGAEQVLLAKEVFHILIAVPPMLIFACCACFVFGLKPLFWVLIALHTVLYIALSAAFGVLMNLKYPNLTWTSEMVPVKQSIPVFFSLFGGFGYAVLLGVLGWFGSDLLGSELCALLLFALTAVLFVFVQTRLINKGKEIFVTL